ncbi:MAG: F0F1 ATP synthase subunit B [Patescibacteria group bacterium]|nr:F0F1 ATP synthase subunit B [Patescibacteria group bacterium]
MESIITTFHIDWRLLIAQAVNFGLVVGVLWWFAVKPLTKLMAERSATIEKSLHDAEEITKKLQVAEEEKRQLINHARVQSQEIIAQGQARSAEATALAVNRAKEQVKKIIEESKREIANEQKKMMVEAKSEIVEVVTAAVNAVLATAVDKKVDAKLVEETVSALNQTTK